MITCALFYPFAFWQACWDDSELKNKTLITLHQGGVELVNPEAKKQGIRKGMSLSGAKAYSNDLNVIEANSIHLKQQWQVLLNELYSFTHKLESPEQGIVFLDLSPQEAKILANYYACKVAVASSKEYAHLIALTSFTGVARVPEHEDLFLAHLPTYYLKGVGLDDKTLDRLNWLGIQKLGQLLAWRKSQAEAFFGTKHRVLLRYLYGPFHTEIATFTPAETITIKQSFPDSLTEPFMIEPYLRLLAWESTAYLADKSASYIHLSTKTKGLSLKESKRSKYPLNDAKTIFRYAQVLLYKSDALALGIDEMSLELSGLFRLSEQGTIWQTKENIAKAIQEVEERFPEALLKFKESNPHALISEHKFELIRLSTGEPVSHESEHNNEEQLARAA